MSLQHESMSSVDTAWLHMDRPNNLMVINGVMTFADPLDYEAVRARVEARLLCFDRFRQRVVPARAPLTTPAWELDPHFDIRSHLHHVALPAPGGQAQLHDLLGDLMSQSLDMARPLWHFYLVDNFEGGSAIIYRMHHCVADGIALVRVLLSLVDEGEATVTEPDSAESPPTPGPLRALLRPAVSLARSAWHLTESAVHEGIETLLHPTHLVDAARLTAAGAARLARITLYPSDPPTVYKGNVSPVRRVAWTRPLDLQEIKAIGKHFDGTINDTLVTIVSGALRRYLVKQGEPVENLNIRAYIPYNLRPPDEPPALGNKFGLVFLALPLGIADPRDRMVEVKRRMDEIKRSPEALVAYSVLFALGYLPTEVERLGLDFYGMKVSAVMTNVPGPRQPVYFTGSRMRGALAWVPQTGDIGLGISIFSYAGEVLIGVTTSVTNVPEPQAIIDCFEDELATLRAALVPATPGRCQAQTRSGRPCRKTARPGSAFCHIHQEQPVGVG